VGGGLGGQDPVDSCRILRYGDQVVLHCRGEVRTVKISAGRVDYVDLLTGNLPKLAVKQVDNVEDISFHGAKQNHRVSFEYNKDLGRNVERIIDNATGETVKEVPTPTQVAHLIRMKKLMGLYVDKKA